MQRGILSKNAWRSYSQLGKLPKVLEDTLRQSGEVVGKQTPFGVEGRRRGKRRRHEGPLNQFLLYRTW